MSVSSSSRLKASRSSFWISASPVWPRRRRCSRQASGLPGFASDPLPDLAASGGVGEDDEVLVDRLGDLLLDLAARRRSRESAPSAGSADEDRHAALLGDGGQREGLAVHRNVERPAWLVPAQLLDEQRLEVEACEAACVRVAMSSGIGYVPPCAATGPASR